MSAPCLVATLGGKAQVLTFALDALLHRDPLVRDCFVLHHAPLDSTHRLRRALSQLQADFRASPYRLHLVPLRDAQGQPIHDLDSEAAARAAWQSAHNLIGALKKEGRTLHLCLTGGRRLMALTALSVAALHFTARDHLWQLCTPAALRAAAGEGRLLHAPADGPQPSLFELPVMPGSELFPALRTLLGATPAEVRAARLTALDEAEAQRCATVWAALTRRQREVLRHAADGATPLEVARALVISRDTVSSHLNLIYRACRLAWALPEGTPLDFHWLRERFGRWTGTAG